MRWPAEPDSALAIRLRRETEGEVLFGRADRGRYATDASIYQMQPIGVLVPRTIGDVVAAMAIAREEGVAVLPRGAGTSQCGQTVNHALVLDCSKYLRRVLELNAERRAVLVEPGIVLGQPQCSPEAAWIVLSGRSLDPLAVHDRRHGRQQLVRGPNRFAMG